MAARHGTRKTAGYTDVHSAAPRQTRSVHQKTRMADNRKQTSQKVSRLAAQTLHDPKASAIKKRLAASALAQSHTSKQTGATMEHEASEVLHSPKYSTETKTLAASVLAQSSKERKAK